MMPVGTSDGDGVKDIPPFPAFGGTHGEAALLLVESLIHALIERAVIDAAAALEIVEVAMRIREEIAVERGDAPAVLRDALTPLNLIHSSLAIDASPINGTGGHDEQNRTDQGAQADPGSA